MRLPLVYCSPRGGVREGGKTFLGLYWCIILGVGEMCSGTMSKVVAGGRSEVSCDLLEHQDDGGC